MICRLCRDVNDDNTIFTKFSLVFPCENEKPQTNFYILENNTISTYHLSTLIMSIGKMLIENLPCNEILVIFKGGPYA